MLTRRGLITGLISLAAAPAIVRVENLMPIKVIEPELSATFVKILYESTPSQFILTNSAFYRLWYNTHLDKLVTEPITYEELYK